MSKAVLIGIVSTGGVGAVGVGGYALFGNGFGSGSSSNTPVQPATDTETKDIAPTPAEPADPAASPTKITQTVEISGGTLTYEDKWETLDSISQTVKDWECFTGAFGSDLSFDSNGDSNPITWTDIDFGDPIDSTNDDDDDDEESQEKSTGCARVQARKNTFSVSGSTKYTGVFSWAWAFKGTQKGLAFFGVAKTNTTSKKLDVEGVVYILDKKDNEGDSETWTVTQKQTSGTDNKTLASNEAGNKLPTPNSSHLSGNFDEKTEGEWLNAGNLNHIADGSETDGTQASVAHSLTWNHDPNDSDPKVYEGCTDLKGGDHLFNNTSSTLKGKLTKWTGGG